MRIYRFIVEASLLCGAGAASLSGQSAGSNAHVAPAAKVPAEESVSEAAVAEAEEAAPFTRRMALE